MARPYGLGGGVNNEGIIPPARRIWCGRPNRPYGFRVSAYPRNSPLLLVDRDAVFGVFFTGDALPLGDVHPDEQIAAENE